MLIEDLDKFDNSTFRFYFS